MDFMSFIFIVVNVTLFLTTETFLYMQKLYKITVLFAVLQLASTYFAMGYFHLNLQQLLLVMLGYYAITMLAVLYRMRMRVKHALLTKG